MSDSFACRQAIEDARYALEAFKAIADLMLPEHSHDSLQRVRPEYLYRLICIVTDHTATLLDQAFELAPNAKSILGGRQ